MPNDCTSTITIIAKPEEIDQIEKCIDEIIPCREHIIELRTRTCLQIQCITNWEPPIPSLIDIHRTYNTNRNLYIKCIWNEEGGMEGVWVTTPTGIRDMRWQGPPLEAYHLEPNPAYETQVKNETLLSD